MQKNRGNFQAQGQVTFEERKQEIAKEKEIGVVCSGHEAKIVRKIIGPNLLIFTPFELDFCMKISSPRPSIEKPKTSKPQQTFETDAGEKTLILFIIKIF